MKRSACTVREQNAGQLRPGLYGLVHGAVLNLEEGLHSALRCTVQCNVPQQTYTVNEMTISYRRIV